MNICRAIFVLSAWLLLASALTAQPLAAAPADEVLARVHWLGLSRISADTNSAHFTSVWRLPQTTALVARTLGKFSRWPGGGATNAASALLRPLLDDLVSSESCWELRASTNSQPLSNPQPSTLNPQLSFALAIRLPADRVRLWQTNLAAAVEVLTGVRPVPDKGGWVLRQTRAPERIEFSRTGEWTLVGWGPDTDGSLSEFAARVTRDHARSVTNFWLEADLDLSQLVAVFSLSARVAGGEGRGEVGSINIPTLNHLRLATGGEVPSLAGAGEGAHRAVEGGGDQNKSVRQGEVGWENIFAIYNFHLTMIGKDGNVLTRGTFNFSRPLDLPLLPWEIPTNLIHGPLTSFTAVRGLAPWLAAMPAWQKTGLTPPPDQAYFWSRAGIPFQTYCAAPLPAVSNQLWQLAGRLVQNGNPWLATNAQGSFQWATNLPGLFWNGALILSPHLEPAVANQRDYLLGGLYTLAGGGPGPPPEILRAVLDTTNLVYYHSEETGTRIEECLFITQLFRVVFHKPQLSPPITVWLKSLEPKLDANVTSVTQTGPEQLAFTRESTVGLTALELHLLADWLVSPQFPHGLHTFLAPPDP